MMTNHETDLRNDATTGLDGSPGNEASAWAVSEINRLRAENEVLLDRLERTAALTETFVDVGVEWKHRAEKAEADNAALRVKHEDLLQLLRSNVRWDGDRYVWVIYGRRGDLAQNVESAIADADRDGG